MAGMRLRYLLPKVRVGGSLGTPSGRLLSLVIFAAAVALASCAGGGSEGLSDLRVCAAEAYDEEEEECSEDQRERPLKASAVYCSAKVEDREGERVTGRFFFEGEPLPTYGDTLPSGSRTFSVDFYFGSGLVPGGNWACELSLGSQKMKASFQSAGPIGPVVNFAVCRTPDAQTEREQICRRDESGAPLEPTDSVNCSATVVGRKGKVMRVDLLHEGRETGVSAETEIPNHVMPAWAHFTGEQNLPEGDYLCRFSLAGEQVGEKRFSIASGDGQALGEASPLAQRLVQPGELAGFVPGGPPQIFRTARAWATGSVPTRELVRETARLRRLGFVVAIAQFFKRGGRDRQAVSYAVQVGSDRDGRAQLFHFYEDSKAAVRAPERFVPFAVPGIPGARGFDRSSRGAIGGHNILFADGPFFYFVGAAHEGSAQRFRIRAEVIAAAVALYGRVRGLPPP
jgi:hypothetical protein